MTSYEIIKYDFRIIRENIDGNNIICIDRFENGGYSNYKELCRFILVDGILSLSYISISSQSDIELLNNFIIIDGVDAI